jgi:hypothetical protein
MSRRPLRTHGRRFALGLTLMLVAGAIAVPAAFASDYTYETLINATHDPGRDGENTSLRYHNFTFTLTNTSSADRNLGSANVTVPPGITVTNADVVDGKLNKKSSNIIEFRQLMIKNGQSGDLLFGGMVNCSELTTTTVTFDIVTKASPDFGGKGLTATLQGNPADKQFSKDMLCPPPESFGAGDFLENEGGSVFSFDYGSEYFIKVLYGPGLDGFRGEEGPVTVAQQRCLELVGELKNPNFRLAQDGLYPVWTIPDTTKFAPGDTITFTKILPQDQAGDGPSGAPTFKSCYMAEKKGDAPLFTSAVVEQMTIDFTDPILLDTCTVKNPVAPCSTQRKLKDSEVEEGGALWELDIRPGDFLLKVLYPAFDPMKF